MTRPISELMNLTGRRALVTGGAGHIGQVASAVLLELGATVTILDLDAKICEAGVKALSAGHNGVMSVSCNLGEERATRKAVREAIAKMGGLDILIHCAAFVGTSQMKGWAEPFDRQTVEAWEAGLRVNLTAGFTLVQEARTALESSGHGSVIFIASTYGIVGTDHRLYEGTSMAHPMAYSASKGGLLQLSRSLATTLAPKVRVNAVSPGGIERDQPKIFQARYAERTPLKRMATEEDMKGAVAYLASDLSAYVTGHNLVVDGGWTAW